MTNMKKTKRALLSSVVSLILCFSMLLGTTYAWFTDSVTSKNNIITAGNLDVELYYQTEEVTTWTKVDETTNVFKENVLWEPGHAEVVKLKVVNEGSLALKYQLSVNVVRETEDCKNVAGEEFKLSNFIDYGIVEGEKSYATRDEAIADVEEHGDVTHLSTPYSTDIIKLDAAQANQESANIVTMVVYMPSDVGNDANYRGSNIPTIELGINLVATQVDAESDAFGNDYDEPAPMPVVSAPAPIDTTNVTDIELVAGKSNETKVDLPAGAVQAIINTDSNITSVAVQHSEPKLVGNTLTFESFELVDQNGKVIDLEEAENAAEITVTLSVDGIAEGSNVLIYHDGTVMGSATVTNGKITYTATHFCEIVVESIEGATLVMNDKELQTALNDAGNGAIILLGATITGDVTVEQKAGVAITINGAGNTFEGVIIVDGKSARYEDAGLTIKNVNFDAKAPAAAAYINLGKSGDNNTRYTNHVTIENCTFSYSGEGDVVAVKSYTGGDKNLTLVGCVVNNGLHSFLQVTNVEEGLNIIDCKVNAKNGINLNNTPSLTMVGCNFNVTGYAVRVGVNGTVNTDAKSFKISNSILKSECAEKDDAVIIFRDNAKFATLTLENTLLDGEVTFSGNNESTTLVINDVIDTPEELRVALHAAGAAGAGNSTIDVAGDIDMTGYKWVPVKVDGYHGADIVTLNGNNHKITGLSAPLFAGGFAGGSGIIISDLTIADSIIVSKNTVGSGAFIESVDSMDTITLKNCHLLNSVVTGGDDSRTGGLVGWTSGYSNENDGPVKTYVTITDCSVIGNTIQCKGSVGAINGHAGASDWTYTTIENCTIQNNKLISTDDGGWRVGVVVGTANVGSVVINNITESGNTLSQTGKTAPEGQSNLYGRFVPGETGTLVIDGVQMVSTAAELADAIANGKAVELTQDINLSKIDLTDAITNDVVINANGHKITTTDAYGIEVTAGKNVTISNANIEMTKAGDYITYAAGFKIANGDYEGATITLKNCTITMANTDWAYAVTMPASVKNLNLVIDNCTLEGAIAVQCWGDNNNITITNSELICNYTTSALYTSYCVVLQSDGTSVSENNTLVIDNCEFKYSGVDNFNSPIYSVDDLGTGNTVTVTNCTYGEKVVAE